jgi:hypothetical protein
MDHFNMPQSDHERRVTAMRRSTPSYDGVFFLLQSCVHLLYFSFTCDTLCIEILQGNHE